MISFDNIKTRKGLFPETGEWKVEANCGIQTSAIVSKEAFEANPKIFEGVAAKCKHDAWNFIYGDLFGPIKELQALAIKNARPGEDETDTERVCAQINKLLRLP